MWEQGNDTIPIERLNDFCNLFKISIDYALELTSKNRYPKSYSKIDHLKTKTRLKEIRKSAQLTQEELATSLKITRSLISKYENGTNTINTDYLLAYSNFFSISTDYLLGKIDEKRKIKKRSISLLPGEKLL